MTATTYRQCYRVLHVEPGGTWEALRLAYRRRVHLCHPDRMDVNGHDEATRDEEFKQVVEAYRLIAAFHKRYGELPPPWLGVSESAGTRASPGRNVSVRDDVPPPGEDAAHVHPRARSRLFTWRPSRFHGAVFVAFVLGVGSSVLVGQIGQSSEVPPRPASQARISVGMDPQSVVNVQGVPNYTKGSVWFYGESGVIFERGCVIGWENQPPFPLRTLASVPYLARGVASERKSCTPPMH